MAVGGDGTLCRSGRECRGWASHRSLAWRSLPIWLPPALYVYYSVFNPSLPAGPVGVLQDPIGAILALRRDRTLAIGGFSLHTGSDGKSMRSNDEVELIERLRSAGDAIWFHTEVVADYLIHQMECTSSGCCDVCTGRRAVML